MDNHDCICCGRAHVGNNEHDGVWWCSDCNRIRIAARFMAAGNLRLDGIANAIDGYAKRRMGGDANAVVDTTDLP